MLTLNFYTGFLFLFVMVLSLYACAKQWKIMETRLHQYFDEKIMIALGAGALVSIVGFLCLIIFRDLTIFWYDGDDLIVSYTSVSIMVLILPLTSALWGLALYFISPLKDFVEETEEEVYNKRFSAKINDFITVVLSAAEVENKTYDDLKDLYVEKANIQEIRPFYTKLMHARTIYLYSSTKTMKLRVEKHKYSSDYYLFPVVSEYQPISNY